MLLKIHYQISSTMLSIRLQLIKTMTLCVIIEKCKITWVFAIEYTLNIVRALLASGISYSTSATQSVRHKINVGFYFMLPYFYDCLRKGNFRNTGTWLKRIACKWWWNILSWHLSRLIYNDLGGEELCVIHKKKGWRTPRRPNLFMLWRLLTSLSSGAVRNKADKD